MIITLIQARTKSNRLPNKCTKLMAGSQMASYTIEGAKKSKLNHFTGLIYPKEDIKTFFPVYSNVCFCFAGSEENVLDRYYRAYKHIETTINQKITHIVRITADCPMLAFYPRVIDEVIEKHLINNADFTHNRGKHGFPSGLDVEIMKYTCLEFINKNAFEKSDREHVTSYIKNHDELFKIYEVNSMFNFDCKWSVDTLEDFLKVSDIIKVMKMREKYER